MRVLQGIGRRIVPGVLVALGVTLVVAGLFSFMGGVLARPLVQLPPVTVELTDPPGLTADASPGASLDWSFLDASPSPDVSAGPSVDPSLDPQATDGTAGLPWPTGASDRVVTRVVVRDLGIDLAVIAPTGNEYPLCGVAMYYPALGQPGSSRATYIYAHARTGMFLPILKASEIQNGKKMLGMVVDAYTSDNLLFRYEIIQVRRHQTTLADAAGARTEQLWLQTSEGPAGTPGKTQVVTRPLTVSPADPAEAHPKARPRVCS